MLEDYKLHRDKLKEKRACELKVSQKNDKFNFDPASFITQSNSLMKDEFEDQLLEKI
jgi:hypothetical protein